MVGLHSYSYCVFVIHKLISALFLPSGYVCRFADLPGKFDPNRAKALGLKAGPLFAKIVKGESVRNLKGEIVHPKDVLGPARVGRAFAMIDCPSLIYMESLLSKGIEWIKELDCVANLCDEAVATTTQYEPFVECFPPSVHVCLSQSSDGLWSPFGCSIC
jgi:ribonuclease Z